jgi:hypothetical protein
MDGSILDPARAWDGCAMQLVARGDWRRCEGTRNAAAIAALGVPIAPQKTFRVREGNELVIYLHAAASVWPQWQKLGTVKKMLNAWKQGELDALHAFVDARRAIHNAELLSDWLSHDMPCALGYEAGRNRTRLTEGSPAAHSGPYARVASLAKAAALATHGFPVLALEAGEDGKPRYVLPRLSVPMMRQSDPIMHDASELLGALADDSLPPTHPFRVACLAAKTWLDLMAIVADDAAVLMFRSAGTRSSFVHSQANRLAIMHSEAFAAGRAS